MRRSQALDNVIYYGASAEILDRAANLRRNMTHSEKLMWDKLRNRKVKGAKFRRQHPIYIFIADFYCHEYKLVVEIDGSIHDLEYQHERDQGRDYMMNELEIQVLRFKNSEVEKNIKDVIKRIEKYIDDYQSKGQ